MIHDILPVNNYIGNSGTTTFDFDFYIENSSQLEVYLYDKNEIKVKLTENIDYSINELKNTNGSYITFPLENSTYDILDEDHKLSLVLSLPISQETEYNNSSLLNLNSLEYSLDYLTRLIQILSRKLNLCVKTEEGSAVTPDVLLENFKQQILNMTELETIVIEKEASVANFYNGSNQIYQYVLQHEEFYNYLSKLQTTQLSTTLSSGTIALENEVSIYKITPSAAVTLIFDTTLLTLNTNDVFTFELYIDMSTIAYSLTFPSSVTWQDAIAPDLSETGKYFLVFRTMDNGSNWLGNLQGVW